MLFTACNNEPEHIYDDHSADLVGTWSCFTENYAEVIIINADGSAVSYGVEDGEYWENVRGTVVTEGGNITMTFEDNDNFTGHFDIIPNQQFSLYENTGERYIYQYCANDLSDEIIGMWVCNDGPSDKETDMVIQTFNEDGTVTKTGWSVASNEFIVEEALTYKVVGDLLFHQRPSDMVTEGVAPNFASKLTYMPNAIQFGDMLTNTAFKVVNGEVVKLSMSMLRIKQNLDLNNKNYDYSNIYVTNVKGEDKEFEFAGQTLNFSTLDGSVMNKMMKHLLFNVSFADNKIFYNYYYNGENLSIPAPIVVDGNKMTIKKSVSNPIFKDIDVWTFQDQDNTQMHMYMPVSSFEKFIANTAVELMAKEGKLDLNDAEAVTAIYDGVANAIETINVSFIFKTAK